MLGRTDSRGRLLLLLLATLLVSTGMMARLAYWQIGQHSSLAAAAAADSTYERVIPAQRGTIYDRTGTIVLAQTIILYRVIGDPHDLNDTERDQTVAALIDYLSLSDEDAAHVRAAMASDSYYVVLATGVSSQVVQEMLAQQAVGGLLGITFEEQPVRVYPQAGGAPNTSLASQLLGFVNDAGDGQYGLEQEYNTLLAGRPEVVEIDPNVPGPAGTRIVDKGTPGEDIRTTIDASLQLQLEKEVFAAWIADRAKTVSAVVMDPTSGAVLAEASYPAYDANNFVQTANQDPELFQDPVISEDYEPGSVFKMLTASAALETKTTSLSTEIDDYGILKLPGGQEVDDADRRAMGWMTFADIVAWSRNVGASQVAFRLGKTTSAASEALYQTWESYGIGQKTGIDLAGEAAGIVRNPAQDSWAKIDLANASFGQGVAVTPIQVVRAYAAMANGGTLVTPHVTIPDTTVGASASATPAATRVISTSLSKSLTGLMEHVVTAVPSYAERTYIPGYYIGGKTGTAQIWDPTLNGGKGGWKKDDYNYSFYGWVGHSKPDLMIGAVIFEGTPTLIRQGVLDMPVQSYELFRRIATDAVTCEQIPPNPNGPPPPGSGKTTPEG
ncbi:MAG: penicillin-binding protein 2 [Candidatus Limnocylindrales bacterium]|jgi:cell division protein FtsI/penicillin-binding protein 2